MSFLRQSPFKFVIPHFICRYGSTSPIIKVASSNSKFGLTFFRCATILVVEVPRFVFFSQDIPLRVQSAPPLLSCDHGLPSASQHFLPAHTFAPVRYFLSFEGLSKNVACSQRKCPNRNTPYVALSASRFPESQVGVSVLLIFLRLPLQVSSPKGHSRYPSASEKNQSMSSSSGAGQVFVPENKIIVNIVSMCCFCLGLAAASEFSQLFAQSSTRPYTFDDFRAKAARAWAAGASTAWWTGGTRSHARRFPAPGTRTGTWRRIPGTCNPWIPGICDTPGPGVSQISPEPGSPGACQPWACAYECECCIRPAYDASNGACDADVFSAISFFNMFPLLFLNTCSADATNADAPGASAAVLSYAAGSIWRIFCATHPAAGNARTAVTLLPPIDAASVNPSRNGFYCLSASPTQFICTTCSAQKAS